jgi:hypothetical protein
LKTRLYQRLLAADQEEAGELIEEHMADKSLVEVYDTLLLPALAIAEKDHYRGDLDDGRHRFVRQSLKDLVEELGERNAEESVELDQTNGPLGARLEADGVPEQCILCLPARDEADEITALMLDQILKQNGFTSETVSALALASEMVDQVERRGAQVVCISAMPPAAVTHARYLCKRLRAKHPELKLIVGLWGVKDLAKAKSRIGFSERLVVAGSLAQTLDEIRRVVQPHTRRVDTPLETPTHTRRHLISHTQKARI